MVVSATVGLLIVVGVMGPVLCWACYDQGKWIQQCKGWTERDKLLESWRKDLYTIRTIEDLYREADEYISSR